MSTESKRKRRLPLREVLIIVMLLALLALLALPVARNTMYANLARTCQGNLKEWGTIFAMYRAENNRYNPLPHGYESFGPASNAAGCSNIDDAFDFAPDVGAVFPNYGNDTAILACPDAGGVVPAAMVGPLVVRRPGLDPKTFGIAEGPCAASGSITRPGAGYTYFGFEMKYANDEDPQISEAQARLAGLPATGPANVVALLEQFQVDEDTDFERAQGLRGTVYNRGTYMEKLGWPYVPYGGEIGYAMMGPLNDKLAVADSSAAAMLGIDTGEVLAQYPTMPVMWDTIHQDAAGNPAFNHGGPDGCNVLFMDGHVEFKEYPGAFPVSKTFATMKAVR